ncbi:MAG: trimethylamine methyltransferase family protein, partial [Pseudomonadota bacterium]
QKLLGGLDASPEAMARDAYEEVAPAGHFLGCGHTMRNYTTAFYEPALSDSENVESWEEGGSKDMRRRAYERWTTMLTAYAAPPLDEAVDEALRDYISRRKSEIPEAWY